MAQSLVISSAMTHASLLHNHDVRLDDSLDAWASAGIFSEGVKTAWTIKTGLFFSTSISTEAVIFSIIFETVLGLLVHFVRFLALSVTNYLAILMRRMSLFY